MKKTVSIVGGGACALMLGAELDPQRYTVTIYERNNALARKFLVAGDGGLNLTHSENPEIFVKRYTPGNFISKAFHHFSNVDLIDWLHQRGIPTFIGSSKRVFPSDKMKPIQVLNKMEQAVLDNGTTLRYKHTWIGFDRENRLCFETPHGEKRERSDIIIFCLGGASWSVTGSRGEWAPAFREKGVRVTDFVASNCAYRVLWPEDKVPLLEGKALKNISLQCGGKQHTGEVVLTRFGMEGSGLYPLSPQIREGLLHAKKAELKIDLKPAFSLDKIKTVLESRGQINLSDRLKRDLKLSTTAVALLKTLMTKEEFLNAEKLAIAIKNLPIVLTDFGDLDQAISTVGGISLDEVDQNFELKKCPGIFVIGEMLDYDAPTGGYLLQSCFTMAKFLANHLNGE